MSSAENPKVIWYQRINSLEQRVPANAKKDLLTAWLNCCVGVTKTESDLLLDMSKEVVATEGFLSGIAKVVEYSEMPFFGNQSAEQQAESLKKFNSFSIEFARIMGPLISQSGIDEFLSILEPGEDWLVVTQLVGGRKFSPYGRIMGAELLYKTKRYQNSVCGFMHRRLPDFRLN